MIPLRQISTTSCPTTTLAEGYSFDSILVDLISGARMVKARLRSEEHCRSSMARMRESGRSWMCYRRFPRPFSPTVTSSLQSRSCKRSWLYIFRRRSCLQLLNPACGDRRCRVLDTWEARRFPRGISCETLCLMNDKSMKGFIGHLRRYIANSTAMQVNTNGGRQFLKHDVDFNQCLAETPSKVRRTLFNLDISTRQTSLFPSHHSPPNSSNGITSRHLAAALSIGDQSQPPLSTKSLHLSTMLATKSTHQ